MSERIKVRACVPCKYSVGERRNVGGLFFTGVSPADFRFSSFREVTDPLENVRSHLLSLGWKFNSRNFHVLFIFRLQLQVFLWLTFAAFLLLRTTPLRSLLFFNADISFILKREFFSSVAKILVKFFLFCLKDFFFSEFDKRICEDRAVTDKRTDPREPMETWVGKVAPSPRQLRSKAKLSLSLLSLSLFTLPPVGALSFSFQERSN